MSTEDKAIELKMHLGNSGVVSSRSGGVRHPPEADIESIRDLLRGYGSSRGILKELIQNAEDAGASRMDLLYVPGDTESPQSLLRGPGFLVVNDGDFTEEHRDAISQISLGTKGTEDRAIGRFGKGLKSVFAWCEAFYIIARTDPRFGWTAPYIADLFNPWHGWRHLDWDEEFQASGDALVKKIGQYLDAIYSEPRAWLALWFPLRRRLPDVSPDDWIYQSFPGEDPDFFKDLTLDLRILTPSLVTLRRIQMIRLADETADVPSSVTLEFEPDSQRIPPPDAVPGDIFVDGKINLLIGDRQRIGYEYCGCAGRLEDHEVVNLKAAPDWPRVVRRSSSQNDASCRVKGEPHFAALISSEAAGESERGALEVRWCVFFPVGKQPADTAPLRLSTIHRHITINLHGFFFLDSDRLRIDGLEDHFKPNGATSSKSCVDWNHLVASWGTLARLPEGLDRLAKQQSFDAIQCNELAETLRKTWVWGAFSEDICRKHTWRPRWQSGMERWENIPADNSVLVIPNTSQPEELIEHIPSLRALSQELTLVAIDKQAVLPGLHHKRSDRWAEHWVLQLLRDVQVDSNDKAVATWINTFLNYLHDNGDLTPAIRSRASELSLLEVRESRTNANALIAGHDWLKYRKGEKLFGDFGGNAKWIGLLSEALPGWSCYLASELPRWFGETIPPPCNSTTAAQVVLGEELLGGFVQRKKLVEALTPEVTFNRVIVAAIRFLMHGDSTHARDTDKILFVPSTQEGQQIWARVLDQLLAGGGGSDSWRLLHDQWTPVLSPQLQRELTVMTIDATGLWSELMNCGVELGELDFPVKLWSTDDICTIFEGLFQSGTSHSQQDETVSIVRKLPLHTLRGRSDRRVSIADADGCLSGLFILNAPGFETDLPQDLQPLWQAFLSETNIVEDLPSDRLAATVQTSVFRKTDPDGDTYLARLDWNYVVRRSLDADAPVTRAPLIMEALSRGDQSVRGLGPKLKKTKWIPLALGGNIAPDSVIRIEGLDDDLHRLLDPEKDGLAGIKALQEEVSRHRGFTTLRNYLPRVDQALEMLGLWLADKADWHLGLTNPKNLKELEPILSQLEEFENVPAAALLMKCRSVRVRGYDEGIDPLIVEHLLPAVLKSFDYSRDGVERIEAILHRLEEKHNRSAFDAYLKQACDDNTVQELLPGLSLVNQVGQWIPATQLIWPSTNLDPKAQLCLEQTEILAPLHAAAQRVQIDSAATPGDTQVAARGYQLLEPPDFDAEADKLREYLQPFRTGNVGETLPAALVAVLGGNAKTTALLQELLHSGVGLKPEDFMALLLGDRAYGLADSLQAARFLIEIVRGDSARARTITGGEITVEFTNEIRSLIVGDPRDLWYTHYYRSRIDTACHRLRLRWIGDPERLEDAVAVFASTIETVILKVHCNGVSDLCPANIREVLSGIADAGQTDLKRSRSYLLDMAEARLKELAVKDVPQLNSVLKSFAEARQARVDAELLAKNAPMKSKQRMADAERLFELAKRELVALLEAEQENATQRRLVDAVRRKMNDYQYGLGSLAFEIFQNADDAVAELEEMQNGEITQARRFMLRLDDQNRTIEIIHWGRPINRHEYPGFHDGLNRGYDQDLQKMLTLNFSDKGVGPENHTGVVTGRFGLGFKSVFFLAQEPAVISGRLAFCIKGGFFPVPLIPSVAEDMRRNASVTGDARLTPTALRLKWGQHVRDDEVANAIGDFVNVAPLLPIFSRRIKTVVVVEGDKDTTWTCVETKFTDSGWLSHVQVGNRMFFCFRCPMCSDDRPATVLFHLDGSGVSPLPREWTGLWITTPTAEHSDLSFALNAPFKPDAGRQRLALSNYENRTIAEEVAHAWGDALIELFDYTNVSWDRFSNILRNSIEVGSTGTLLESSEPERGYGELPQGWVCSGTYESSQGAGFVSHNLRAIAHHQNRRKGPKDSFQPARSN
jgi:hypothetical protein